MSKYNEYRFSRSHIMSPLPKIINQIKKITSHCFQTHYTITRSRGYTRCFYTLYSPYTIHKRAASIWTKTKQRRHILSPFLHLRNQFASRRQIYVLNISGLRGKWRSWLIARALDPQMYISFFPLNSARRFFSFIVLFAYVPFSPFSKNI